MHCICVFWVRVSLYMLVWCWTLNFCLIFPHAGISWLSNFFIILWAWVSLSCLLCLPGKSGTGQHCPPAVDSLAGQSCPPAVDSLAVVIVWILCFPCPRQHQWSVSLHRKPRWDGTACGELGEICHLNDKVRLLDSLSFLCCVCVHMQVFMYVCCGVCVCVFLSCGIRVQPWVDTYLPFWGRLSCWPCTCQASLPFVGELDCRCGLLHPAHVIPEEFTPFTCLHSKCLSTRRLPSPLSCLCILL